MQEHQHLVLKLALMSIRIYLPEHQLAVLSGHVLKVI
jgi:hypothetical protein